jgi:pilus assembly protein CpaF
VHIRRYDDGVRRIESIAELTGLEGTTPLMQEIFAFRRRGRQGRRVAGHFTAMGIVPRMVEDLRDQGVQVPPALFQRSGEVEP